MQHKNTLTMIDNLEQKMEYLYLTMYSRYRQLHTLICANKRTFPICVRTHYNLNKKLNNENIQSNTDNAKL
jgi:hypothetical protein